MNKQRRKEIARIKNNLTTCINDLKFILDEECEAYDNMGDGLQCTQRGMDSEDAIDAMEEAIDLLEGIL